MRWPRPHGGTAATPVPSRFSQAGTAQPTISRGSPPSVCAHAPPPPLLRAALGVAAVVVAGGLGGIMLAAAPAGAQTLPVAEGRPPRRCGNRLRDRSATTSTSAAPGEHREDHDRAHCGRAAVPLSAPVTVDAQDASVETMRSGFPSASLAARPDDGLDDDGVGERRRVRDRRARSVRRVSTGSRSKLNATAKDLGMKDSILDDPAGLDDPTSYKDGPYMSAYDLAIATRNALTVPDDREVGGDSLVLRSSDPSGVHADLVNHNKMLPGGGVRLPRRDRVQDRIHGPGRAHVRRARRRATAAR